MATSKPAVAKFGPGRWRFLLFASLALNLLIVGMVAGALLRGGPGGKAGLRGDAPPLYNVGYGPYGRAFSKADRKIIAGAMAARSADLRENREEFRARSLTLLQALRAVPYDPDVVLEIVSQQQASLQDRQSIGRSLLLDHLAAMDDEARSKYANRLERSLHRGGRRN